MPQLDEIEEQYQEKYKSLNEKISICKIVKSILIKIVIPSVVAIIFVGVILDAILYEYSSVVVNGVFIFLMFFYRI